MSSKYVQFLPKESTFQFNKPLVLESGEKLENPVIAYQTWGKLNKDQSNVVWVCHALTGNHLVHQWWDGLFGPGKFFDPKDYYIVAVNVIGSCYGTTGPLCFQSKSKRYYRDFPLVTIRDMVQGLEAVRQELKIDKIKVLIGASVGGQQVLEWAYQSPERFETIIPIATNAVHSPFGIAFNEAQRLAIEADSTFHQNEFDGGKKGLIAARAIGMISYRTYEGYRLTQSEADNSKADGFKSSSYQRYQGEKLANRFNAYSYWYLSKAMDSHNLGRGRISVENSLSRINVPALVIGIDSDILFPVREQEFLAKHLPDSTFKTLSSDFGHDGFLVEFEALENYIKTFFEGKFKRKEQSIKVLTQNNPGADLREPIAKGL